MAVSWVEKQDTPPITQRIPVRRGRDRKCWSIGCKDSIGITLLESSDIHRAFGLWWRALIRRMSC
jgi:hypothetical protein